MTNRYRRQTSPYRQRGLSLLELMIAGALSVVLGLVAMQLMIGSNRSAARLDGISQAQENARFTLTWLAQSIRRGGFHPDLLADTIPAVADNCTSNSAPPATGADCTWEAPTTVEAGDRIAIRRVYVDGAANGWDQQTCSGADLNGFAIADGSVIVDVYWVERDSDPTGVGDAYDDVLRCATYRQDTEVVLGGAQTIASGIESMQVLMAAPGADASAQQYLPSNMINGDQGGAKPDVTVVRIAILARAFSNAAQVDGPQSFVLLDGEPLIYDDGVPRQVMETTVFFSNRPISN